MAERLYTIPVTCCPDGQAHDVHDFGRQAQLLEVTLVPVGIRKLKPAVRSLVADRPLLGLPGTVLTKQAHVSKAIGAAALDQFTVRAGQS